jgi:uncharacterized small protein (DUF1192 family)
MDEFETVKPASLPTDLTTANIEDLETYITALESEIERVTEIIRHKRAVGSLAESLFSTSDA